MNNDFVPFRPKKLWWRRLRFALRYLKNRHGFKVHSPFIFRLITQVIEEKWDYYAYQDIQTCIWEMQDSESEITVCLDGGKRGKTVPVSVFMKRYDITPSHGELLFRLCNFFHPEHILQIGAGSGLATLYLSWYAPGLNMAVIDEVHSYCSVLVEELLDKSEMGRDSVPDLLSLTYYTGIFHPYPTLSQETEIQDTYVRTDRSLAHLLELLDHKVGLRNVLFCLTSTGCTEPQMADTDLYRIPGGEFYLNRCATLLNMFLMATYGEGQYAEAYYNQQIYLNHKLIEDKQLDLTEIQEKAAEFLMQFSGVNEVYSAHRLLLGSWSPKADRIRNSYHRLRSGDLLIEVLPGWTVMHEDGSEHYTMRTAAVPSPFILLNPGIRPETVRIPVSVARIAPTVAGALRIRAPNASTEASLDL